MQSLYLCSFKPLYCSVSSVVTNAPGEESVARRKDTVIAHHSLRADIWGATCSLLRANDRGAVFTFVPHSASRETIVLIQDADALAGDTARSHRRARHSGLRSDLTAEATRSQRMFLTLRSRDRGRQARQSTHEDGDGRCRRMTRATRRRAETCPARLECRHDLIPFLYGQANSAVVSERPSRLKCARPPP